jgi:hypothetical protein
VRVKIDTFHFSFCKKERKEARRKEEKKEWNINSE